MPIPPDEFDGDDYPEMTLGGFVVFAAALALVIVAAVVANDHVAGIADFLNVLF